MGLIERQKNIVKYLTDKDEWVKGNELGKILNVTDRTIRNDIICINSFYKKNIIISLKGKGYKYNDFNEQNNIDYITDVSNLITIERWIYILKQLIVLKKGINLFDLAEELFISESTLQNDIVRIKRILLKINIENVDIIKNGNLLYLECDTSERYMLLYEFAKYKFANLQLNDMQKYFKDINLECLYNSISSILKDSKYKSRYLKLTRVTIFVALVVECRQEINCISTSEYINEKNISIAQNIVEFIEEMLFIKVNTGCMLNIAYYLNSIYTMHVIEDEIRNNVTSEQYILYKEKIINEAQKVNINLIKNKEVFNDMLIHIIVATNRIKNGIKIYNPIRENLKNKYPLLFGVANKLVSGISLSEAIKFDFNELSYIVAYLSTIVYQELENLKHIRDINILLIVSDGKANLNYIYNEISRKIPYHGVNFKNIYNLSEIKKCDLQKSFDLIITTSKEDVKYTIDNYIEIRKSFDIVERNRVLLEINRIREKIIKEKIENLLNYYFSEEIFLNINYLTSEERVIKNISTIFKSDLCRNDPMVISLKNKVGIFYKLDDSVEKEQIAIIKLDNPVRWGNDKARVIIAILDKSNRINEISIIVKYILELAETIYFNERLKSIKNINDLKKLLVQIYLKDVLN